MKTKFALLFSILTIGAALTSGASAHESCDSGYYVTRLVGYDHCGNPIYRQVWVEVCRPEPRPCFPRVNFSLPSPPPIFCAPWSHNGHGGPHHH